MAIVKDYYSPEGCHIIVHDNYYKDITPEENKARLERATQIVLQAEFERYLKSLKKGDE